MIGALSTTDEETQKAKLPARENARAGSWRAQGPSAEAGRALPASDSLVDGLLRVDQESGHGQRRSKAAQISMRPRNSIPVWRPSVADPL